MEQYVVYVVEQKTRKHYINSLEVALALFFKLKSKNDKVVLEAIRYGKN